MVVEHCQLCVELVGTILQATWWVGWLDEMAVVAFAVCLSCGVGRDVRGCTLVAPSSVSLTNHKPLLVHLWPCRTVLPLYFTVAPMSFSSTSHPALHNLTTERRECRDSPGIMCPVLAFLGSCGRSSLHVCVDCTEFPSGNVTCSGWSANWTFVEGTSEIRK